MEENDVEENEEPCHPEYFKPNWPAIITVILALIIVGWLMGRLAEAPNGKTINCPSASQVTILEVGDHVVVLCEED